MATTQRLHANNITTTLSAAIVSTSATSITVTSVTGFPTITTNQFYSVTVSSGSTVEIMQVTSASGTTLTVVRAAEGTTAATFVNGSAVTINTTADSHDRKCDLPSSFVSYGVLGLNSTVLSSGTVWIKDVHTGRPLLSSTSATPSFGAINLTDTTSNAGIANILIPAYGGFLFANSTTNNSASGTISATLGVNTTFTAGATTSTTVFTLTLPAPATGGGNCVYLGNGATWILKPSSGVKIQSAYGSTSAGGSITSLGTNDYIEVKVNGNGTGWYISAACFPSGTPWVFA